ncbi:MAG: zinc ribbon domain-containing protein [Planctomycetota bacterium]
MHPHLKSLLDLHEVNLQRQRLIKDRVSRESTIAEAQRAYEAAQQLADEAATKAGNMDALIRQYTADVERCESRIGELRAQQMTAKTNKEYLTIINGIEESKAEMRLRQQSLTGLTEQVGALQAEAERLQTHAEELKAKVAETSAELAGADEQADSEVELQRIYDEKKQAVDPAFLEHYERLIAANHPMPLMRVDPTRRATPLGNVISHNHLEQVRLGNLVKEATNNAILYVDE